MSILNKYERTLLCLLHNICIASYAMLSFEHFCKYVSISVRPSNRSDTFSVQSVLSSLSITLNLHSTVYCIVKVINVVLVTTAFSLAEVRSHPQPQSRSQPPSLDHHIVIVAERM